MIHSTSGSGDDQTYNQPTFFDRIKHYFLNVPLFTKSIFVLCIAIFLTQSIFDWPHLETFCFLYPVIIHYPIHVYRMVTFFVFHVNVFHIAFNMMALMSFGYMLETKIGTVHMLFSTLLLAFFSSVMQFLVEGLFLSVIRASWFQPACTAGYSGILFAYTVLSAHYEPVNRSLFGAISVPAHLYPWLLLFITSLLFPGVSFLGHLCGIIAGYIYIALLIRRDFYKRFVVWTEKKVPSVISGVRCFYYSSVNDVENQTNSQQSSNSSMNSLSDSLSNATQWIRQRLGGGGYAPLNQSTNNNSQSSTAYWEDIGQGRALGSS